MCGGKKLSHVDRRTCTCRSWCGWYLLRWYDNHRLCGAPKEAGYIHCLAIFHVWHLLGHWPYPGRCLDGQGILEVVLLVILNSIFLVYRGLIMNRINLPVGGAALLSVFFFFKNPTRKHSDLTLKRKIQEMDLPGAFVLICAIVCLLLALQWGGTTYPWHDSKVWGCLLGFGLLVSLFIFLQFRGGDRSVPLPSTY